MINNKILCGEHHIYGPVEIRKSDWDRGTLFVKCKLVRGNGPKDSPNELYLGRCAIKV